MKKRKTDAMLILQK